MVTDPEKAAQPHILVVDDQPANLTSLEQILRFNFQVTLAANGQACLEQVKHDPPDLILLDVDMPLMDGLTVCRMIKADPTASMIPVIFVSALSRLSERLAGYHAGADDYITKPYDVDELLVKIRIALNNRHDLEIAREQSSLAQEEMEDSLAACTELSVLVRFIDDSLDCDDVRTLGERMLDTFERFGLRVIVRMIASGHYFSHAGEVGVLDQEMMENMYEKGRIIDLGHRTLINAESVSVLIRNMPVHHTGRYQRWRENLNLLVEVVNSRIYNVQRQNNKQKERERLQPLINGIHQLIEKLQHSENALNRDQASHDLNRLLMTWESQQL
ncbi:MAG: response regulator [Candidatus Thiodiazotropha sp.]|nr:response regulator [Candidatus Thiodiazotropha sp.]MCM8884383.1 response regulator [Candidatus Thiodiazotropha sp.]MCM8919531.1 response regulator [Candidatus Thiodiazotropha sp.]